jgi:lipopolysaccharide transport system ATP-binding protein
MTDTIIEVDSVSKQYRLGEVSTGSLGHDLNRAWHRLRGKPDPYLKVTHSNDRTQTAMHGEEFVWALEDVSFEVKRGEVLGVIGRNGAGKSTLLKILSRVTAPTTGEIRVDGTLASLLEVGTGFHQDLTGRENIYLNGAILGMTKQEITSKLDEIVEFSGCARYLDTPVKRYSSGMVVRLGFAVAAHLEPDILIVDEVLAVGDAEFQKKCIGKMQDVASHGRTVLFVSHNLASVRNLCQTAIWLDNGAVEMPKSVVSNVVDAYQRNGAEKPSISEISSAQHKVVSPFQIRRVRANGVDGGTSVFRYGEPVELILGIECRESFERVQVGIGISASGLRVSTLLTDEQIFSASDDEAMLICRIPGGTLLPGIYQVDVGASLSPNRLGLDFVPAVMTISVLEAGINQDWVYNKSARGIINIPADFTREPEP